MIREIPASSDELLDYCGGDPKTAAVYALALQHGLSFDQTQDVYETSKEELIELLQSDPAEFTKQRRANPDNPLYTLILDELSKINETEMIGQAIYVWGLHESLVR